MSSREICYPANRRAGMYLALAASATLVAALVLRGSRYSPEHSGPAMLIVVMVPLAAALIASLLYLRKL